MKPGVIYYIECRANGRVYVGSTTKIPPRQRWLEHQHRLRKGDHHSPFLQRAWLKHGESEFEFHTVETVEDGATLLRREQAHVDANSDRLMNGSRLVSEGHLAANAASRGRVHSEQERAKRAASLKRAVAECRCKSVGPWSEERKAAHSKRLTGRQMPPVSEATRLAISRAKRGVAPVKAILGQVASRRKSLEARLPSCRDLLAQGMSLRAIERETGVCRKVLARELGQ